ncbi:MAG TPA: hypothetical protein VGR69_05220 [Candidatus Rubrimentiphilum sp.]|nr:hypothetical protein [Candidatus Rubrimentiphilum sp.]
MRFAVFILVVGALGGCGSPQRLPVSIPRCDAIQAERSITLTATVQSNATKPIDGIVLAVDFYRNFRYVRLSAVSRINPELLPGAQRDVTFIVPSTNATAQGHAMRCFATRLAYSDGTFTNVTPSQ